MNIPAEWLPWIIAILGGGGIGTLITAWLSARNSTYKNLNDLVDQLQEDRREDRASVYTLTKKVEDVLKELHLEREYSAALYLWGMAGAPPPPPRRNAIDPV